LRQVTICFSVFQTELNEKVIVGTDIIPQTITAKLRDLFDLLLRGNADIIVIFSENQIFVIKYPKNQNYPVK
tara:strand:+ start:1354 stop:1569 length:216 start_codon:yes stop_codon:yes gene_type:complete